MKKLNLGPPEYEAGALTTTAQCLVCHLVDECAAMQASDLAAPYIRHLEVCVQQQVEAECKLLTGVVHPNVEMQLLLS
jgi:hypothetical protein